MIKSTDYVDEVRKIRETTYKKCGYDLRTYCKYVTNEAEKFEKERKAARGKNTVKDHHKKAA